MLKVFNPANGDIVGIVNFTLADELLDPVFLELRICAGLADGEGFLLASGETVVEVLVAPFKCLISKLWVTVNANEIDGVVARIPLVQI